jgi:hypothetical protein
LGRKAGGEFGAACMETLHEGVQFRKLGGGLTHFRVLSIAILLRAVDPSV